TVTGAQIMFNPHPNFITHPTCLPHPPKLFRDNVRTPNNPGSELFMNNHGHTAMIELLSAL
ncbi:hypothetical protein, partial [Tomitella biformata]|uniref:hypothetical protein n=1 Tax=Tomitella biformata TaxID=630403 RepID=UPI001F1C8CBF